MLIVLAVLAGAVFGFFLNSCLIGYGLARYAEAVKAFMEELKR